MAGAFNCTREHFLVCEADIGIIARADGAVTGEKSPVNFGVFVVKVFDALEAEGAFGFFG